MSKDSMQTSSKEESFDFDHEEKEVPKYKPPLPYRQLTSSQNPSKLSYHSANTSGVLPSTDDSLENDEDGYVDPFAKQQEVCPLKKKATLKGSTPVSVTGSPRIGRRPSMMETITNALMQSEPALNSNTPEPEVEGSQSLFRQISTRSRKSVFAKTRKTTTSPLSIVVSTICPRCDKDTEDQPNQFCVENKRYHAGCMSCSICKVRLVDEVYIWQDEIVCRKDYFKVSGFTCGVCDKIITKDYVNVNGRKSHTACKKCSFCRGTLVGKDYTILGDAIFCNEHKDIIPCSSCQKKIEGPVVEV